ncbi:LysR family transcriptional regulator [Vibrio sp. MA64]|uniref:LysR family transcriptional regulator n=1 Tax=Vibrio sp. MA64 TaxID=2896365 RepID=UPI001E289074|nr:LysR family transcriptional regulator [Vibrio sp. MA64]MCC9653704.1 LysR family transcriptional regulator [Vibrio sp. MA64]
MLDSIEDLKIFCTIYEQKSIKLASEFHNISSAAGSKKLLAMENQLGVKLFYRTTRKLSATTAGEMLYHHAQKIIGMTKEIERDLNTTNKLKGKIRITASASFTQSYLIPPLSHYMTLHPDVKIEVVSTDALVDLTAYGIDLAIRHGPSKDSSLIGQKLAESKRIVCASPSYIQKFGQPTSPNDLKEHKLLVVGSESTWTFTSNRVKETIKLNPDFSSTLGESVLEMAKLGQGIAVLSDWHVRESISNGELKSLLDEWELIPSITIQLLYPSRKNQSHIVRDLISFLKDWVKQNPI